MNFPKITIITCCYNASHCIRPMIESVLSQTYDNFEHIVIDGASTDDTVDIFNSYKSQYGDRLILISEPDSGISNAINKAFKLINGDVVNILCADDKIFSNNIFEKISIQFNKQNCDMVYGDLCFVDQNNKIVRKFISGKGNYKLGWQPASPAMYTKKEVIEKAGYYDEVMKIAADYDFQLRMFSQNLNLVYLPEYFVVMGIGGASTNGFSGYWVSFVESYQALKNNGISHPIISQSVRTVKTLFQIISSKLTFGQKKHLN